MEEPTIRRRNRLKHHYTTTSNVLLFGYRHVPDAAKLTYQVIDSFDWIDGAGLRKGYAYPAVKTLAEIRGVDERTIQRHLAQLEQVGLITRKDRPGRPSLLVIEDPSGVETQRYLAAFGQEERGDKSVTPTPDKSVTPHLEEDKEQERQISLTRVEKPSGGEGGYQPIGELVRGRVASLKARLRAHPSAKAKREYLAQQMVDVLGDEHSLGMYRQIAERFPDHVIFQGLASVREAAKSGSIKRSRGALFVFGLRHMNQTQLAARSSTSVKEAARNGAIFSRRGAYFLRPEELHAALNSPTDLGHTLPNGHQLNSSRRRAVDRDDALSQQVQSRATSRRASQVG